MQVATVFVPFPGILSTTYWFNTDVEVEGVCYGTLVREHLIEVSERKVEREITPDIKIFGGQVAAKFGSWVATLRKLS